MVETSTPSPQPIGALNLQGLNTDDYLKAEVKLSVEEKAALATYLAAGLKSDGGKSFTQAEAILRLMTWNGEPRVVEAMAKAAAANPNTPHSIAWALANDDEAAATIILEACAALSDADLVSIVQNSDNAVKMRAIARRESVSEEVSKSLIDHGDEDTAHTLLANAGARISDDAYGAVLDRFGQSERIQEGIIGRAVISAPVAQRLSAAVNPVLAGRLADKLAAQGPAAPGYVEHHSEAEWERRLAMMIADKSLNETKLVRNLCLGNFEFFARALAALSKSPYPEVRASLLETPPVMTSLWLGAGLPLDWLSIAAAAVTALIQIDRTTDKTDRALFTRNITERTQANLRADKIALTEAQRRFFTPPKGR